MAKVYWRNPNDSEVHELNAVVVPISFQNLHEVSKNGFVLFPFYSESGFFFSESSEGNNQDELPVPVMPQVENDTTEQQYTDNVASALKLFSESSLDKVVLARQFSIPASNVKPNQLFQSLCKAYPTAFVYTVRWGETTFFGASPELLIEHVENKLSSMALAGTKPNHQSAQFTNKEIEEQAFVQRFIEQMAAEQSLELIRKSDRYEREAGHLKHLCNDYSWNSTSLAQVVRFLKQLHPTPAVAGTPRKEAIDFIQNNENFNRGFYAGFLGEWNPGSQNLFVNLRCGLTQHAHHYLYAGAGISADSDPLNEWNETTEKLKTLNRILTGLH
jgi:isochorismate synthase